MWHSVGITGINECEIERSLTAAAKLYTGRSCLTDTIKSQANNGSSSSSTAIAKEKKY
jgi:hypothetical protein